MSDIYGETVALIESLGELTPHGLALAEAAKALAMDADDPPTNDKGQQAARSPIVNAWRATVAELVEKGQVRGIDEGEHDDWASAASAAGATPIRDAAQSATPDARAGGRKGRSTAR